MIALRLFAGATLAGLVLLGSAGCTAEARKARQLERADGFFAAGDYEKARVEYGNLLRLDPANAAANARLGTMYFEQGAPGTALPFLLKARDADPRNAVVRGKVAFAYLSLGRVAEAKAEALEMIQQVAGQDEGMLILIDTVRTPADYDQAREELRKLNTLKPITSHLASAGLALRRGDMAGAGRALERALAADPKSATAHSAMATYHLLQNKPADAAREFQAAAELSPVRSAARLKFAEFKAQTAPAEAAAYLQELVRQAPDYLPAWAMLAQLSLAQKKYDEALGFLGRILARDAGNYEAHVLRAQVWLAQGETQQAIAGLEKLGESYRGLAADKYHLARAYIQDQARDKALAALKRAVAANPEHEGAVLLLAQLELQAGRAEAALAPLVGLLTRRPNLTRAQVLLADALRAQGRLDAAADMVRAQMRAMPQSPEPPFLLGMLLLQQNRLSEARASFEKALELAPDRPKFAAQLIDLDIRENRMPAAVARVQEHLAKSPDSADLHFMAGRVHAAQSKWDDAEAELLKTLELDSNYGSAYNLLLYTYIVSQKLPQAAARLEELLRKRPDHLRALILSGMIYGQMDQHPKARDAYEKVLALEPRASLVMNNLAVLYLEQFHQLDRALELARKARDLEPESPAIADTLGWILVRRGEPQAALELLTESAARLGGNGEVQYHLGVAHQMTGNAEAARAALLKAVSHPGEFPGKADARERLGQLGGRP